MVEVEGARHDRDKGAVSLDGYVRLDEPWLLMTELEKIAKDCADRGKSDMWRFIAKWAAECNEELAKNQEPPPR